MKARTPYWPLMRYASGFDHIPRFAWGLWVAYYLVFCVPLGCSPLLFLHQPSKGNLATFFSAFGEVLGFAPFVWLALAGSMLGQAWLSYLPKPAGSASPFEFLFTRALDRRRLSRAKSVVIYALMLTPLLLVVFASVASPDVTIPSDDTIRLGPYAKAFPLSHPKFEGSIATQIALPCGAQIYAGWILCLGTLGLAGMQGYCAWVITRVTRGGWWAGAVVAIPVCLALIFAFNATRLNLNLGERSFLFFALHPIPTATATVALVLAVQAYAERRFSLLEIL